MSDIDQEQRLYQNSKSKRWSSLTQNRRKMSNRTKAAISLTTPFHIDFASQNNMNRVC